MTREQLKQARRRDAIRSVVILVAAVLIGIGACFLAEAGAPGVW